MKKILELKDSVISINGEKFLIKSKNASLGISFSERLGFTLDSLKNSAAARDVEYINEPQCFLPIGSSSEIAPGSESSHELMNAVTRKDGETVKAEVESGNWELLSTEAEHSFFGGAKVLKLSAEIKNESYKVTFNSITFPECSVIRYWFDIENLSSEDAECKVVPVSVEINSDSQEDIYRAAWFNTANSRQNFGRINEMDVTGRPRYVLLHPPSVF